MDRAKLSRYRFIIAVQVLLVLAGGLICTIPASAQYVGGRVSGRVTDPSGVVVPGAQVVARNTSTNVVNNAETNGSGYYTLQLNVGVYEITASKEGFQSIAQQNITVTVGGDVGLDFALQLATTKTVVQVQGVVAPLITPNEASVQTTVDRTMVTDLPVEVSGGMRNSADFLKLTPGYTGSSFEANINGGDGMDQEVLIDGADESPVGFGSGIMGAQMTVPSFAVQEFQVISNNVDAQYGRTSTGAIKFVFKSGTNGFHGDAFEYVRNQDLDARNFFAGARGVDQQNEFGAEVGGPIIKNKTFFYGYYDGYRFTTTNNATFYSLLTPAMIKGDFSAPGIPPIYDPASTVSNGEGGYTRTQFSCPSSPGAYGSLNVICPNNPEISSISQYFANLFPAPTLPGLTNNYLTTSNSVTNSDQFLAKIDQSFSSSSQLNGSYSWMREPETSSCSFGNTLCSVIGIYHGDRAIVNWTKNISTTMLNHLLLSFNIWYFYNHYGNQANLASGSNLNEKAGLTGILDTTGEALITVAGGYYLGVGGSVNKIAHSDGEIADDFTWIRGSHEMQFGFNVTNYQTIGLQLAGGPAGRISPFGSFAFNPQESGSPGNAATGFGPASYILGQVDIGTYGQQPSQAWVMPYRAVYAQDKWKIRHNLTASYGLRWDYNSPITDRQNRLATFDPTLANPGAGGIPGALEFAGYGTGRAGVKQFANAWHRGFGPRIGLTYAPTAKTVLRGAYGIMYDGNSGPSIFSNQQGYFTNATESSLNNGVTPAFNWQVEAFPAVTLGPYFDPTFANGGSTAWMQPNGARLPIVENYNVGFQRELWGGIVLDASYVGTQTHHMLMGSEDINQLNPTYLPLGAELDDPLSASSPVSGIALPYTGFSGTVAQALRPFPQFQGITTSSDPIGNATYNALQIRIQQRLSHGISYLITYTDSKNLTDAPGYGGGAFISGAQNYYDLRVEKSLASYDIPQSFVGAYTYDLPIGKGKALNISNPILDRIIGGWRHTGIVTFQSGSPIGVGGEQSLPGIGGIRPNRIGGVNPYITNSRGSFHPCIATCPPGYTADLYMNIGAFADAYSSPANYAFGDVGAELPNVRTFGHIEWDAALMKRIPITERFAFTLKGEFFNVLNTVNFGGPSTDIDAGSSFGQIFGAGSPRLGQLSGTLSW
jgi:hypothetical protein